MTRSVSRTMAIALRKSSSMKRALWIAIVTGAFTAATSQAAGNRLPQGGGVAYPAWTGTYWDNPEMEGEPRWEQSEIRVRFDWEDWRPIIGSRGETVIDFPKDGFSARLHRQTDCAL